MGMLWRWSEVAISAFLSASEVKVLLQWALCCKGGTADVECLSALSWVVYNHQRSIAGWRIQACLQRTLHRV